jgi:hypothetical protein
VADDPRIPFRSCDPPKDSLSDGSTWLVHKGKSTSYSAHIDARESAAPLGSSRISARRKEEVMLVFDEPIGISPSPAPCLHVVSRRFLLVVRMLSIAPKESRLLKTTREDLIVASF